MRPTESEGVFLQFGDIAVYDGGEISGWWPTFPDARVSPMSALPRESGGRGLLATDNTENTETPD